MTFLEILRDKHTCLPIESESGDFRKLIREKLNHFGAIIDSSENLSKEIEGIKFTESVFKKRNKILREGILKTIDAYYEGEPTAAFSVLSKAMREANVLGYLKKDLEITPNTDLFRIRLCKGNYPLERKDLFHIPFESRSRVNTQRFSIPGLPSLYLANSIYVAWEEMKRPSFSDVQAVRLINTTSLKLLDLSNDIFSRNEHYIDNESHGWELLYYVMVWPLIAACSFKVKEPDDPFKPEYILPQLLLQWVNKKEVDGIKYSSTHINLSKNSHVGDFYNIVIPTKTSDIDQGYCPQLLRIFDSTPVIPLELRQFLTPNDRLDGQESIKYRVNKEVEEIELIIGRNQPYYQTVFGMLEHSLIGLDTEPLDF